MANKFLDNNGVLYLWNKIKSLFVQKEDGKGLSSNDFTDAEKTKLSGIEAGANKYVHPTTDGNKHIPTGGSDGQVLKYGGSSGTATWANPEVIAVDDALSSTSTNPVQNKVVNTALGNKISTSARGAKNGVASLDANGLVPSSQLPSYVDDVIEGYYFDGAFYKEETHKTVITGETGKIYVDLTTNMSYRYGGTEYVKITSSDMVAITNAELDTICV